MMLLIHLRLVAYARKTQRILLFLTRNDASPNPLLIVFSPIMPLHLIINNPLLFPNLILYCYAIL